VHGSPIYKQKEAFGGNLVFRILLVVPFFRSVLIVCMCIEKCKRIIGLRISYGNDILIDSGLIGSGGVEWALRMWKGFSRLRIVPLAGFCRQSWNEFRD
jgi:hypothetical protein